MKIVISVLVLLVAAFVLYHGIAKDVFKTFINYKNNKKSV